MKTILVAAQKGGVGKSTIASEIAFDLKSQGFNVAFANLDNQGSQIFPTTPTGPNTDYMVVDTAGHLEEDFQEMCRAADLVVIPTKCGKFELEPLKNVYNLAITSKADIKVGVVLNEFDSRHVIDRLFEQELLQGDFKILGNLPRTESIKRAQWEEQSVREYDKRNSAATMVRHLTIAIRKEIG